MNPARENILGRVRAALRVEGKAPTAPSSAAVFPPVTDLETRFREEFIALKGEIITDLPAFLDGFAKIASAVPEVTGSADVRQADLGVTGCDCLLARTGSIAVCTRSAGGRALSVLPPVHLVIACRSQLVPDLTAALAFWHQRYDRRWPSNLSVITGPSRTGDIEKILVMGAHGPKRLVVYFAS
ncbi:MAG: lactate utilization protein [Verrucomicrobiota bacterium]